MFFGKFKTPQLPFEIDLTFKSNILSHLTVADISKSQWHDISK